MLTIPLPSLPPLRTVPPQKILDFLQEKISNCNQCSKKSLNSGLCQNCTKANSLFLKYAQTNIPVMYWNLDVSIEFKGDSSLKNFYDSFIKDLLQSYRHGKSYCLAGKNGIGKTFVCTSILKRAIEKNMTALYVNLSDILECIHLSGDDKIKARKELLTSSFLIIDEFDPRYIGNSQSADFFGRNVENVLRTRQQNKLPTIFCTNSLKPLDKFEGSIKTSLESLFNFVEIVYLTGQDHRKK